MPRRLTPLLALLFPFVFVACGGGAPPSAKTPEKQAPASSTSVSTEGIDEGIPPPPKVDDDDSSSNAPNPAPQPLATKPLKSSTSSPTSKNATSAAPIAGATTGASSSSPSPESVCAHVVQLVGAEFGNAGSAMPSDQQKQMHDDCVKESVKEQSSDPKGYACDASCILAATSFAGIQACKGKC